MSKREEAKYDGKTLKLGKNVYGWIVKEDSLAWSNRVKNGNDPILNRDTEEWGWTDMRTFTTSLWHLLTFRPGLACVFTS